MSGFQTHTSWRLRQTRGSGEGQPEQLEDRRPCCSSCFFIIFCPYWLQTLFEKDGVKSKCIQWTMVIQLYGYRVAVLWGDARLEKSKLFSVPVIWSCFRKSVAGLCCLFLFVCKACLVGRSLITNERVLLIDQRPPIHRISQSAGWYKGIIYCTEGVHFGQ